MSEVYLYDIKKGTLMPLTCENPPESAFKHPVDAINFAVKKLKAALALTERTNQEVKQKIALLNQESKGLDKEFAEQQEKYVKAIANLRVYVSDPKKIAVGDISVSKGVSFIGFTPDSIAKMLRDKDDIMVRAIADKKYETVTSKDAILFKIISANMAPTDKISVVEASGNYLKVSELV